MEIRKILFVDDEPLILDGMRRMLRNLRENFALSFATGAREALELMNKQEFDVVVADLRMPEMDGMTLFMKIQEQYPETIRIMLTAQSEMKSSFKASGIVHQYLIKPCKSENLKRVLFQASALHRLLKAENGDDVLLYIDSLPGLCGVYRTIEKSMARFVHYSDDVNIRLSEDLPLTARLFDLINSSIPQGCGRVECFEDAVDLLGLSTLKDLIMSVKLFSLIGQSTNSSFAEALMSHSLIVGDLARKIAESVACEKDMVRNSYLAGIFHDIGKLIMAPSWEHCTAEERSFQDSEFGHDAAAGRKYCEDMHCHAGAYAAGIMDFPSDVVEAIGFHHQVWGHASKNVNPSFSVYLANAMYHKYCQDKERETFSSVDEKVLRNLGMARSMQKWWRVCSVHLDERIGVAI